MWHTAAREHIAGSEVITEPLNLFDDVIYSSDLLVTWGRVLTDFATDIPAPAPLGTMVESEKKNQLSLAYLQMVAATAGFEVAYWKADYNGVDATLRSYARYEGQFGAEIDLQLKCTSHEGHQHADFISYPLERPVFEKLSDDERFQLGAKQQRATDKFVGR